MSVIHKQYLKYYVNINIALSITNWSFSKDLRHQYGFLGGQNADVWYLVKIKSQWQLRSDEVETVYLVFIG